MYIYIRLSSIGISSRHNEPALYKLEGKILGEHAVINKLSVVSTIDPRGKYKSQIEK